MVKHFFHFAVVIWAITGYIIGDVCVEIVIEEFLWSIVLKHSILNFVLWQNLQLNNVFFLQVLLLYNIDCLRFLQEKFNKLLLDDLIRIETSDYDEYVHCLVCVSCPVITCNCDSFLCSMFQLPVQVSLSSPAAKEWFGQRRENIRQWTVFVNTGNFRTPSSIPRLSKRVMRNVEYFQSNYFFVFLGLLAYCL